jgi:signal transduction histidine kinase
VIAFLDELLAYVQLDDAEIARLRALHPRLEPHFPAIAARFYEAITTSPSASSVLTSREQIERLHVTLVDWMSTGLLGPYDERFYQRRTRIGRRHVTIGLAQQYMFTGMSVLRSAYQDRIVELYPLHEAFAVMRAVNKLFDVELAIMVRHYQLDSEDKLISRERRIQADRITSMQTLTAGLAHEVRNPLNAARLQLELLERRLRRSAEDPRLIEPSELAQKEIERLTVLLNEFLQFARPPELHPQDCDVAQLVRQVVDLERLAAERRGAELAITQSPEHLLAHVDAAKLHQVVLNLLRNAIEAVSPGGHVSVEVAADPERLLISVADDGPGIPEQVRPRIYEPFFSTKEGGTGLGMSIVHSLVALHGGTIDLVTGPSGTRFEIGLPRRA